MARRTPLERKVAMFNLQRRALKPGHIEIVLCPRCLKGYGRDHLQVDASRACCKVHWTVEDAPTVQEGKRLQLPGSYRRVLTCNVCNNGAGDGFENSHALLLSKYLPDAQERIQAAVQDVVKGEVDDCAECGKVRPLKVDITDFVKGSDASRIMELKEAYVLTFGALGYSYAMCSQLDDVRAWIAPNQSELPVSTCARVDLDFLPAGHLAVVSGDIDGIVVALPAHHAGDDSHVVFLPRPGGLAGVSFYREIQSRRTFRLDLLELHPWPPSGHPPFHWDQCKDWHPRSMDRYQYGRDGSGMTFEPLVREDIDGSTT